ncbi:MAG: DUF669 domain-containing protein [Planctomycetaceae bacterium]|nr:DUF669 domain-containing protein [Planctomycetaceae bacterium]
MANLQGFDANTVEPATEFDTIPAGKYLAVITESEIKPTKSGNGSYLQLMFEILDGQYKGRHLWSRLNLDNPNETAVKIARAELSAICRAVGVMAPNDSVDLHNLPLLITVRCKKRPDTGDIGNEIKGYAKREAVGGQPQQATGTAAPWRRA